MRLKTELITSVFFPFIIFATNAQSLDNSIIGISSRERTTSLNGKWEYIVDPYETGFYNYRFQQRNDGFFENKKDSLPMDLIEYGFEASKTLNVPGDWNTQDKELFYYEGSVWYKKTFDYDLKKGNLLHVHFGGANYKSHIYLNGIKLGTHEGGFTSFNFEITPYLRAKNNDLVVMVENKRAHDRVKLNNRTS